MNVVKDVNNYENFLPFCAYSKMSPFTTDKKKLVEKSTGILHIGFANITDKYTSRVVYDPQNESITAYNIKGNVFEKMTASWKFKDKTTIVEGQGPSHSTEYEFKIDYKMGNPLYTQVAKTAFPKISDMMVKSFEKQVQDGELKN